MSTSGGRGKQRNRWLTPQIVICGLSVFAFACFTLGTPGGSARALALAPADKGEIVFASGGRIISIKADGSDRKVLTRKKAWVGQPWGLSDNGPMVSPDGESILFNRYYDGFKNGAAGPMIVGRDGSGLRRLYDPPQDRELFSGAWAPDGERIYLLEYAEKSGDRGAVKGAATLFTVRPDGTARRTVLASTFEYRESGKVTGQKWVPIDVVPAPDGRHLLVETYNLFADKPARLEWVDPRTGSRKVFESDAGSPSFSPDGSQVAFASDRDRIDVTCYEGRCSGNPQIFVKEIESGTVRRLLPGNPVNSAWDPAWSPDGSRIAFASDRTPGASSVGTEIWTVAPDGGCLNRITNGAPDSSGPGWVPGGGATPCVELTPRPLAEVTVGKWALEQKPRPLWAGPSFKGSLMNDTFLDGQELGTAYDDCGAFDGNCAAPVSISSGPVCLMNLSADLMVGQYLGLERLRGGLLVRNVRRAGVTLSHFYSGGLETRIASPGRHRRSPVGFSYHRAVVSALRPVDRHQAVSGSLGDPVIPWKTVRKARAMVRAFGQTHSLRKAAGKAGVFREKDFIGVSYSRAGASAWLRFGRDLERLGKVRSVRCKRWANRPGSIDVRANFRKMLP